MSAQDIFETISGQYYQLTPSEKKVADYVLAHRTGAQYLSISELAEEAWTLFSGISPKFVLVPDSHQQMAVLALMEAGDAVLYFSYSGSTRELLDALEVARSRKGRVILITRFPRSPGGQRADVVLQCGSNEGPLQAGSVPARLAQLFTLDLLYTQLFQRDPQRALACREQIAGAIARRHV